MCTKFVYSNLNRGFFCVEYFKFSDMKYDCLQAAVNPWIIKQAKITGDSLL